MRKLMILLEEFEQAAREHTLRGLSLNNRAEYEEICSRYQEAKLALVRAMQQATQRKGETE